MPLGVEARPGSMGRALPGVRLWVDDGELVADPATVPTFFTGYLGRAAAAGPAPGAPATACAPARTATSTSRAARTT